MQDVFGNVTVLDKSARDSIQNFEAGNGDVAITYENEVLTAQDAGLARRGGLPAVDRADREPGGGRRQERRGALRDGRRRARSSTSCTRKEAQGALHRHRLPAVRPMPSTRRRATARSSRRSRTCSRSTTSAAGTRSTRRALRRQRHRHPGVRRRRLHQEIGDAMSSAAQPSQRPQPAAASPRRSAARAATPRAARRCHRLPRGAGRRCRSRPSSRRGSATGFATFAHALDVPGGVGRDPAHADHVDVVAAAINAVMGTLLAYVLVRYRFPGRRVLSTVVDLPFAIPTLVTGRHAGGPLRTELADRRVRSTTSAST